MRILRKITFFFCVFYIVFGFAGGVARVSALQNPKELHTDSELCLQNRSFDVPIIMYHSTFRKSPSKFNVPPNQIEQDFAWIKDNGYSTITVKDLVNFQELGICLPEKPIMLTFDDGYTNNYLYMFPLLKKYELKCVMSVVGILTDRNYSDNGQTASPSWAHMTYEQIKELHDSGIVEIQNHTYNLHYCTGARKGASKKRGETAEQYERILTNDLKLLDEKLKHHCGITTTAVIYPFGAYSNLTTPILKKLGYKASFTCRQGTNKITRTSSLFDLKRNNRPYGKSSEKFFGQLLGVKKAPPV